MKLIGAAANLEARGEHMLLHRSPAETAGTMSSEVNGGQGEGQCAIYLTSWRWIEQLVPAGNDQQEIPSTPSQPLRLVIHEVCLIECNHPRLLPRMLYKVPADD